MVKLNHHDLRPLSVSGPSNLHWLIRLRWLAAAFQAAIALGGIAGWFLTGPTAIYLAVLVVLVSTNALAIRFADRSGESDVITFVLLITDVVLLTLLLLYSGGPSNPLILLYVVHVALGAVMVPPRLGWTVGALVVVCYGLLFVLPHPPGATDGVVARLSGDADFRSHLVNQWLAFSGVAILLAYFVTRVTSSLILRERELAQVVKRAARGEKMASLATLATGAAHELGTPLGTIGLVARELERAVESGCSSSELLDDVRLVSSQVERCRGIIDSMRSEAGEGYELPVRLEMAEIIAQARDKLPPGYVDRVALHGDFSAEIVAPQQSLAQALRNLLKNALDASKVTDLVDVEGAVLEGCFRLVIRDRGAGIPDEVLDRVGEPFYTTKEAGEGMGLGLFVTQAVIERVGGRIRLESSVNAGTRVTVELPLHQIKQ